VCGVCFGRGSKVTFLDNTDNVNFGWFAYDSIDCHPKKCCPLILNHASKVKIVWLLHNALPLLSQSLKSNPSLWTELRLLNGNGRT
jgi:hypothetical protein